MPAKKKPSTPAVKKKDSTSEKKTLKDKKKKGKFVKVKFPPVRGLG